jgi:chromosome partitioning protein
MKKKQTHLRHIVTVSNSKGGAGKTTTVLNLAAAISKQGYRVLVIDTDPQCNLSMSVGWDMAREGNKDYPGEPTIFNAICLGANIPVYRNEIGLYFTPSSKSMADADVYLNSSKVTDPVRVLSTLFTEPIDDHTGEGLVEWESSFDFIFIDSPVGPQVLNDNIFIAANAVLIPLTLERYAMDGLQKFLAYIQDITETENDELKNIGVLITCHKPYLRDKRNAEEELRKKYGKMILPITISEREAVKKSQNQSASVYDIPRADVPRDEFTLLANEIIKRTKTLLQ